MKIAMVSEHASPLGTLGGVDAGGQNVHVAALAKAVAAAGHDVVVYTRRDRADLPAVVRFAHGVHVRHVDAGPAEPVPKDDMFEYMPQFARVLRADWRRRVPDVVHSHFWMSGYAARAAAYDTAIPVVHTYHALGLTKRLQQGVKDTSPADRIDVERELAATCDHIVATSSEEVFELVRMGAEAAHVSLVPCGVDLAHFSPSTPASTPRGTHNRVLVVSRLVERKGIGNVIESLTTVPDAELVIAGGPEPAALASDPEARRLRTLAQSSGVADRVHFAGRIGREDLPELYRSAAVVVCAPWYEPFGLVALEAMACGRPVIASAVGGLVDTVIDEVTGLHVGPRNPQAVAAGLRRVLRNPALGEALGRAGAARARARYGWSVVARDTVQAYRRALRTVHRTRAVV
jgi:glycosyltransferase involved in cell wall biosynthesis